MAERAIWSFTLPNTSADWQGDGVIGHLLRAPTEAHGGGFTILEAWAVNEAATGSGTGFGIALHNYGTAGTAIKSSGGTIAAEIGGTALPWAQAVAQDFTLSNPFIDAGEYVVAAKEETNSSDPTRFVIGMVVQFGK